MAASTFVTSLVPTVVAALNSPNPAAQTAVHTAALPLLFLSSLARRTDVGSRRAVWG